MDWWSSTGNKLRAAFRLTGEERVLVIQAMLFLPVVALALRVLGFVRLQRVLARVRPAACSARDVHAVRGPAWAVAAAARHGAFRANCLQQSLVLWWLLRRRALAAELRIGVRKDGNVLQAHAWIEVHGLAQSVTGDAGVRFTPFEGAITSAGARSR